MGAPFTGFVPGVCSESAARYSSADTGPRESWEPWEPWEPQDPREHQKSLERQVPQERLEPRECWMPAPPDNGKIIIKKPKQGELRWEPGSQPGSQPGPMPCPPLHGRKYAGY